MTMPRTAAMRQRVSSGPGDIREQGALCVRFEAIVPSHAQTDATSVPLISLARAREGRAVALYFCANFVGRRRANCALELQSESFRSTSWPPPIARTLLTAHGNREASKRLEPCASAVLDALRKSVNKSAEEREDDGQGQEEVARRATLYARFNRMKVYCTPGTHWPTVLSIHSIYSSIQFRGDIIKGRLY